MLTGYPAGFGLENSVLLAFSNRRWAPRDDLASYFGAISPDPSGRSIFERRGCQVERYLLFALRTVTRPRAAGRRITC